MRPEQVKSAVGFVVLLRRNYEGGRPGGPGNENHWSWLSPDARYTEDRFQDNLKAAAHAADRFGLDWYAVATYVYCQSNARNTTPDYECITREQWTSDMEAEMLQVAEKHNIH